MGIQQRPKVAKALSEELIELAGLATSYKNVIPSKLDVCFGDEDVLTLGSKGCSLQLPASYSQLTGVERTFSLGKAIGLVLSHRFNPVVRRYIDDSAGTPDAYCFFVGIGSRYVALNLVRRVHATRAADWLAHDTRSKIEELLPVFFQYYKTPEKVDWDDPRIIDASQLGMWFGTRLYQKHRGARLEEFCALSKIKDVCAIVPPPDAQPYLMKLHQWEESDQPSE